MTLLVVSVLVAALVVGARRRWRRRSARGATPPSGSSRRGTALIMVSAVLGIQVFLGAPAFAQDFDCKQAPNPERPGAGMVGALDPAPIGVGQPGSAYYTHGYSGLVWHTYDLGCGPSGIRNPNAIIDTWVGNELFNIGKNLVGATNGLHYTLLSGDLMAPLDDLITTGTVAMYNSAFTPWFGLAAVILAVIVFRHIWRGDLASIGKRGLWALAGLWFASATYLTPLIYTHALDGIVISGTSAVQAGFLREVGVDERNALPTALHDNVIYRNWLRGEFGSPDSPQAQQFGQRLLWAQSWTKVEVASGADAGSPQPKKDAFEDVAGQLGGAYGNFQGIDGSRVGSGMLASVQGFAYASFQLLAKATILLAQVLLRVLILAGPLIGLIAIVYHQVLRSVGRALGAMLLTVVVMAALAGMHTLVLTWIFSPLRGFSLLTQMMLAALVTIVFFMVGRPIRRLRQMVELSVGTVGRSVPTPAGFLSRVRGRRGERERSPQDDFWDNVRTGDPEDDEAGQGRHGRHRRRRRPEGDHPVTATAERADAGVGRHELEAGAAGAAAGSGGRPALPAADGAETAQSGRNSRALPEGRSSRIVDTAPVADAKWDQLTEEPVLVPSARSTDGWRDSRPRRAEKEVVAGQPVYVVYRPSRGLEVDGGPGQPPRDAGDGQRRQ